MSEVPLVCESILDVAAKVADTAELLDDVVVVGQKKAGGFTFYHLASTDIKTAVFLLEAAKAELFAKLLRG